MSTHTQRNVDKVFITFCNDLHDFLTTYDNLLEHNYLNEIK